ncbi:MAG: PLD nuclease N-terminal domain-containing protein [Candidatus Thorarchaeota archaeon]
MLSVDLLSAFYGSFLMDGSGLLSNVDPLLLLIIPILVIHAALAIYSLIDIRRSPNKSRTQKVAWGALVCFVSLIGPALYLLVGREER